MTNPNLADVERTDDGYVVRFERTFAPPPGKGVARSCDLLEGQGRTTSALVDSWSM